LKTPAEVQELALEAPARGWGTTALLRGSQKGRGFRLHGAGSEQHKTILFHPGGGHHGTYWKVSGGEFGNVKVFPWLTEHRWGVGYFYR